MIAILCSLCPVTYHCHLYPAASPYRLCLPFVVTVRSAIAIQSLPVHCPSLCFHSCTWRSSFYCRIQFLRSTALVQHSTAAYSCRHVDTQNPLQTSVRWHVNDWRGGTEGTLESSLPCPCALWVRPSHQVRKQINYFLVLRVAVI